jgi:hypothetical protein
MKTFRYRWLHIPTGTTGEREVEASALEFLTILDRWNGQDPGRWQYWRIA